MNWPGYIALGALFYFSKPLWWSAPLLLPHLYCVFAAVVGLAVGAVRKRFVAYEAEVTGERIVLTTPSGTRSPAVGDLVTVAVDHATDHDGDDKYTSLRLEWPSGAVNKSVSVTGDYEPTLAASVSRVLGRPVPESRRGPLGPPSGPAFGRIGG
ncbi:hypothetical protein [Actinomadura algeriensis]|uniref:DUF3592 domain-containing protein n=1 Tax=Actinomadura algeriensis TaxID=1679523 RepID=A0ABR9JL60_9ACTN|nr:hypothetical protein [Actinomadura algeriensis]MBE1531293.1 hypothetical protein [Actinomadura algeriensis]